MSIHSYGSKKWRKYQPQTSVIRIIDQGTTYPRNNIDAISPMKNSHRKKEENMKKRWSAYQIKVIAFCICHLNVRLTGRCNAIKSLIDFLPSTYQHAWEKQTRLPSVESWNRFLSSTLSTVANQQCEEKDSFGLPNIVICCLENQKKSTFQVHSLESARGEKRVSKVIPCEWV